MAWSNSVVTNAGLALMADVLAGAEMTITTAALGEGTCDVAALMAQTELTTKNDTATVDIAAAENLKEGIGKSIRLQVRNTGMEASVVAKQFGLYAKTTGDEVLFAIMQDDTGEEIPSEAEYSDFMLEFTAAIALSQTEGITVIVSGSSIVTAEDLQNAINNHKHTVSDISDFPSSLPANGGNAATVGGHTVQSNVPANAKFTDTVYTHPTYTARTGVPTGNQTPAFGGTFQVTQPVSDGSGHITGMNSRTITIPATAASASAAGLMNTGAQTFAGAKTFNASVYPNGATAYGTPQARKLASGTAVATTTNCPSGAWYGQHS